MFVTFGLLVLGFSAAQCAIYGASYFAIVLAAVVAIGFVVLPLVLSDTSFKKYTKYLSWLSWS